VSRVSRARHNTFHPARHGKWLLWIAATFQCRAMQVPVASHREADCKIQGGNDQADGKERGEIQMTTTYLF
jgi:hypothetical protein